MARILDELIDVAGRGIQHFRHGFDEAPISLLLFYPLSELNNPNFDFERAKVKHVKHEKTQFGSAAKITWYEDNIKETGFAATAAVAAKTLTIPVDASGLQVGDQIKNIVTGECMLVTGVPSSTSITVDVNEKGVSDKDGFIRYGFAKTYGIYSARKPSFGDYVAYDNYVQFVSAEIPQEMTDILTMNLDRTFYPTVESYLAELYATASREIVRTIAFSLYAGRSSEYTTALGDKIYSAGGLEYYIPDSAHDVNIKGATEKATMLNLQRQIVAAYKSGVAGIQKANRLMLFVNYSMSEQITTDFWTMSQLNINDNNMLEKFGINVKQLNLNGYRISIVEDPTLDQLYPTEKVGFIVDLEGIVLYNLINDVVGENGKTAPKLGTSVIFAPFQQTYEMRIVSLNTHFTWLFKNISSGAFRKIVYK